MTLRLLSDIVQGGEQIILPRLFILRYFRLALTLTPAIRFPPA
jgi:hypothetical protein